MFLNRLTKLFSLKYNLILKNAKSADNIIKEYRNVKKKNIYSHVLVMYDLDLIKTIDEIHKNYIKNETKILKSQIYFVNPKFELIFVMCKTSKTPIDNYCSHIKKIYGIENYEKTKSQLESITNQICTSDINDLIDRMKRLLSKCCNDSRSTNYDELFSMIFII